MTENKQDRKWGWKELLLSSGLAVALLGNGFQFWQNVRLQQMNVRVEKISEFRASGADLDRAVIDAFDNLAEGGLTDEERQEFQTAFIDHVIETESRREFLGAEETDRYLEALNVLKREVELSHDATGAGQRIEALGAIVEIRREISERGMEL